MLRELLDRLCRRGDFEPIGPDEMPELPAAMREAAIRDRLERSDYAYTPPSAIDLSGVETTFDPNDVWALKPGEPRAQLAPMHVPSAPRGGYPDPMPRMRVDDDLLPRGSGETWSMRAQAIVRALAERRPPNGPDGICRCCAPSADEPEPEHDATCPYLRAVEWVEANPA